MLALHDLTAYQVGLIECCIVLYSLEDCSAHRPKVGGLNQPLFLSLSSFGIQILVQVCTCGYQYGLIVNNTM